MPLSAIRGASQGAVRGASQRRIFTSPRMLTRRMDILNCTTPTFHHPSSPCGEGITLSASAECIMTRPEQNRGAWLSLQQHIAIQSGSILSHSHSHSVNPPASCCGLEFSCQSDFELRKTCNRSHCGQALVPCPHSLFANRNRCPLITVDRCSQAGVLWLTALPRLFQGFEVLTKYLAHPSGCSAPRTLRIGLRLRVSIVRRAAWRHARSSSVLTPSLPAPEYLAPLVS